MPNRGRKWPYIISICGKFTDNAHVSHININNMAHKHKNTWLNTCMPYKISSMTLHTKLKRFQFCMSVQNQEMSATFNSIFYYNLTLRSSVRPHVNRVLEYLDVRDRKDSAFRRKQFQLYFYILLEPDGQRRRHPTDLRHHLPGKK